eukprot:scpid75960/ scgid15697/ 
MSRYEVLAVVRKGLSRSALKSVIKSVSKNVVESDGVVRNVRAVGERRLPLKASFHGIAADLDGTKVFIDFVADKAKVEPVLGSMIDHPHIVHQRVLHLPDTVDRNEEAVAELQEKLEFDHRVALSTATPVSDEMDVTAVGREVVGELLAGDLTVEPISEKDIEAIEKAALSTATPAADEIDVAAVGKEDVSESWVGDSTAQTIPEKDVDDKAALSRATPISDEIDVAKEEVDELLADDSTTGEGRR